MILTMAKYHENLLKDSTLSLLFEEKFYYRKQRQRAISEQVFMMFGHVKIIKFGHQKGHISQKYPDLKIIFMQK